MTIIRVVRGQRVPAFGQVYPKVLSDNLSVQDALVYRRQLLRLGQDSLTLSDSATANTGGNVIDTGSASSSAVSSAISSASNGDTVRLPSGGSATWTANVAIPSTKFITLDGNDSTITFSGASGSLTHNAHATGNNRVTGFNFIRSGSSFDEFTGPYLVNLGGATPITDRCTFGWSGQEWVLMNVAGLGPGLMYLCDFGPLAGGQEAVHVTGLGSLDAGGWAVDVVPGSSDAYYVEDCTFHQPANPSGFFGCSGIQSYYGARTVARYNTLTYCQIDQHGTTNAIGARWWEFYENTFVIPTGGGNQDKYIDCRAGSGVVFNNHKTGPANDGAGNIEFEEEDASTDAYSVGTGKNGTTDTAYVWGNDASMTVDTSGPIRSLSQSVKPGYTPYTYPHPLRV